MLEIQEWISLISNEERERLKHTFRFDSHPSEFVELMKEFREKYDFIPSLNEDKEKYKS